MANARFCNVTVRSAFAALAALCLFTSPLRAEEAAEGADRLSCTMVILCIEASPCTEWEQTVQIAEGEDGQWSVEFGDDLPSDFTLAADLPAPEGSLEPTDVISLMRAGADTQAVQLVTLAGAGEIVITLHQPHLRPRSVTGYGVCADRSAEEASE